MLFDRNKFCRASTIDTNTACEAGIIRRADRDHLSVSTQQCRVLYSFGVTLSTRGTSTRSNFHEIHTEWMETGRSHAGIILAQQKRYSTGEQIRRLMRLIGLLTEDAMRNREEFLGCW